MIRANSVFLDARQVKTKFSKTFVTNFVPIGGQARTIVADWLQFLTKELLWGPEDPLFPKTRVEAIPGEGFWPVGLDRSHWSNASPIRRIFREAFTLAGLPNFNPHSFRDTLVQHGARTCRTPEEFKAFSQNLGHEHVMTTFKNYGKVSPERQSEIIQRLGIEQMDDAELNQLALKFAKAVRQRH